MRQAKAERAAEAAGLASLGAFVTTPEHLAPDGVSAIMMLGLGREGWAAFQAAPEASDGAAHPLDRWSQRVIEALAAELDAAPFFPFTGPPYMPFLRWGTATGRIWPSALGMSIHAEQGLWVSFRGALGFATLEEVDAPPVGARPCDSCADRPCLSACPVDAFTAEGYGVPGCVGHLHSPAGEACLGGGCLARRACPVGQDWTPPPQRARFHMSAFRAARS